MRLDLRNSAAALVLVSVPALAHAQHVPMIFVVGALSPLLVLTLTAVLGFVVRSWKAGALHAVLILVWIVLFGIASYNVENDYIIWTPLAIYILHSLLIVGLIALGILRRNRGKPTSI
jgi:hypothetical protein